MLPNTTENQNGSWLLPFSNYPNFDYFVRMRVTFI